jgi:phage-related protein
MARTRVVVYCDNDGSSPFIDWFAELPEQAQDKVTVRLERLAELGHELRRPEADYLRDGIYELRATARSVHYRVLYFFYGRSAAVVAHGIVKGQRVPDREIERALKRKLLFEAEPLEHSREEL